MAKNAARLAQISNLFEISVVATAHTKFGPIDSMIMDKHHDKVTVFTEKRNFSMIDERVSAHLDSLEGPPRVAVLYGCETHICIK